MRWLESVMRRRWAGIAFGLLGMAVTVILGTIGFADYYAHYAGLKPDDLRPSPLTIFYLAIQLLILQSGFANGDLPLTLDVARFIGPVFTAFTTITTVMVLFAERLADWQLGQMKDHVVVCGLGLKGSMVLEDALGWGLPVVVVEQRPLGPGRDSLRERGAHVVVGDATDRSVLLQAGCARARAVIVSCGDDATNIDVALALDAVLPPEAAQAPDLYVHLLEPELQALLQPDGSAQLDIDDEPDADEPATSGHWRFFSMYDRAAKSVLSEHFVFDREIVERRTDPTLFAVVPGHEPHLAVVGDSPLADSLIDNLVQAWRPRLAWRAERLRLLVIGRSAELRLDALRGRLTDLDAVCDVRVVERHFTELRPEDRQRAVAGLTTAYACQDTDTAAAATALALWRQTAGHQTRIIACFSQRFGFADLVRQAGIAASPGDDDRLLTFSLAESSRLAEILLGQVINRLARLIYAAWTAQRKQDGFTPDQNEYLDPSNRSARRAALWSSRQQALHALHKLDRVGCTIRRLTGREPSRVTFTDAERKDLAMLEHDRWNNERLLAGWELGPKTHRLSQIHRDLVPWDLVPSEDQAYDFQVVDVLRDLLAKVGFEIVRKPPAG